MNARNSRALVWIYREGTEPDPRFTLANERTFLAWIRTALALVAPLPSAGPLGLILALLMSASAAAATICVLVLGAR